MMNGKNLVDSIQHQVSDAQRALGRRVNRMNRDARSARRITKLRARLGMRDLRDALMPSRKALLGFGVLSSMLTGGDHDGARQVNLTRKNVSNDVVDMLAKRVEQRLIKSDSYRKSLARALRSELKKQNKTSGFGRLLNLGMLAAAVYGVNTAARQITGKGLVELFQSRFQTPIRSGSSHSTTPSADRNVNRPARPAQAPRRPTAPEMPE